ncbi:MarR family transcriptional regulator [Acidobacteria bacterium AH-259-D05]|nr:MarR family transcriptional regulator [Acidobacteria bacterium AH-259-D05]
MPIKSKEKKQWKIPALNSAHLAALNVFKTNNLLSRAMSKHLSEFELTISQHSVLASLKANGKEGLALNVLGELLSLSSPNMTNVVDRLEEKGLVVRTDHRRDRRVKIIRLTRKGEELEERVFDVHGQRIESMLDHLKEKDLEDIIRLLRKLRQGLEESGWLSP